MASLVLVHSTDPEAAKEHPIPPAGVVLGRSDACAIQLRQHNVSRRHARIYRTADAWFIADLASTNGICVNDVHVDTCVLRDSDFIKIGSVIFRFQIAGGVNPPPDDGEADGGSSAAPASPATSADLERFRN